MCSVAREMIWALVVMAAVCCEAQWVKDNFIDGTDAFETDTSACLVFIQQGYAGRVWSGSIPGPRKCDPVGGSNIKLFVTESGGSAKANVGGYIEPSPHDAATGNITAVDQMVEAMYCGGLSGLRTDSMAIKIVNGPGMPEWTSNQTFNADFAIELVAECWKAMDVCTVFTNKAQWDNITGGAAPPVADYIVSRLHQIADDIASLGESGRRAHIETIFADDRPGVRRAPVRRLRDAR